MNVSIEDMDFVIGDEAMKAPQSFTRSYPIRHGQIDNWDHMERYWEHCIYKYMKCNPEDHAFLLTEPPLNAPENREYTAEIMFETFNVSGLYIAVQAVLALAASFPDPQSSQRILSGTVVDSGDGVTHVIPVVDGYVIGSAIKHIPVAGRDVTQFIQQFMRDRETNIPPEDAMLVAQKVKEQYGYVCKDVAKEFFRYDNDPDKFIKKMIMAHSVTGKPYTVDVGYERFLGAEVFFNPDIFSADFTTPLPNVVDETIQNCPIDVRRSLYKNVVLSGGTTMFKDFPRRLQRDLKRLVDHRTQVSDERSGHTSQKVDVEVISNHYQRFAVWFGGSMVGCTDDFYTVCHTKADYEEYGPSIARHNRTFASASA